MERFVERCSTIFPPQDAHVPPSTQFLNVFQLPICQGFALLFIVGCPIFIVSLFSFEAPTPTCGRFIGPF